MKYGGDEPSDSSLSQHRRETFFTWEIQEQRVIPLKGQTPESRVQQEAQAFALGEERAH